MASDPIITDAAREAARNYFGERDPSASLHQLDEAFATFAAAAVAEERALIVADIRSDVPKLFSELSEVANMSKVEAGQKLANLAQKVAELQTRFKLADRYERGDHLKGTE